MLQFKYKAIDSNAKKVSGTIEENDISSAAAKLRQQDFIILDLKKVELKKVKLKKSELKEESDSQNKGLKKEINIDGILEKISHVRISEVVTFIDQLASLIESGVSVMQSLEILEIQTENKKFKKVIREIRKDIESGKSLSDSMKEYPKVFNKMIVSIIKTGEETGLIDESMKQVSSYLEEQEALKRQVIMSLVYPTIILITTIGVVIFMVTYVMPKILPFIEMGGGQIPWYTQLLLDAGKYLEENFKKVLIALGTLIGTLFIITRLPKGKYYMDKFKIKIPLIGPIFKYSYIIKFSKTLSILIGSGVSIVPALESTSEVIENKVMKKAIADMVEGVLAGENLSSPIMKAKAIFPPIVESLIKVGEETGGIDKSLVTISSMFQKMFENKIKTMNMLIEPLLMLVMGGMVAFVAAGLMGGILSSYGQ